MSRIRCRAAVTTLLALGCARPGVLETLPAPASPPPTPTHTVRAGLAKRDITPPPGVGLMGNGPEGARSRGYRLRLYVRAVLLEDAGGERVALVTADLAHVSAVLHRKAALHLTARCPTAGIGTDRLFISATHTHSAPGHFYEAANYNEKGSSVRGYDPLIADTISARISDAVCAAASTLRPARMVWGSTPVWGVSRIRSLPAMERNLPRPKPISPPPAGLSPEEQLVNPTLWMLRIDTAAAVPGGWMPAGAYAAFSVHNTANAPSADLLDSDLHGRVAQLVERYIDKEAGYAARNTDPPRSTFAFASGSAGDVSPNWRRESRCPPPRLGLSLEPAGPLMAAPLGWQPAAASTLAECDRTARQTLEELAQRIARTATELYGALAAGPVPELILARAFTTLDLKDSVQREGLCARPAAGLAMFAGAPDSYSRIKAWRVLNLFELGIDEPSARSTPAGCHGHKRELVSSAFDYGIAGVKLPAALQLAVVRVADRLLVFTPAEVTTTSGLRLHAAALKQAAEAGISVGDAIPISLTNGFVQYLATPEEYSAQYYEGGSTIYGPGELPFFIDRVAELTASLATRPTVVLQPIESRPGAIKAVVQRPRRPPHDPTLVSPRLSSPLWCGSDTLYAEFSAGTPGEWIGDAGPKLALFAGDNGTAVAWDDDPRVAIYLTGRTAPQVWQLRFAPGDSRSYELQLAGQAERHRWPCVAT